MFEDYTILRFTFRFTVVGCWLKVSIFWSGNSGLFVWSNLPLYSTHEKVLNLGVLIIYRNMVRNANHAFFFVKCPKITHRKSEKVLKYYIYLTKPSYRFNLTAHTLVYRNVPDNISHKLKGTFSPSLIKHFASVISQQVPARLENK